MKADGPTAERGRNPAEPGLGSSEPEPADVQQVLHPTRRIFVNRTLRFERVRWVGFDMDYTLLPYRKQAMEALSFRLTVEKLIDKWGYPPSLLDIPYDHEFVVRGLAVDKKTGNIFKMDRHYHVGRVYHGRRALTKEERRALYRNLKIRIGSARYHWIDSLFALPEAALYADVIELFEREGRRFDPRKLFEDIRAAIDLAHRDDSLKSIIRADLERFVEFDPDLPECLHKLRSSGKRLFLLTNSHWDYTDAAMRHLLDGRLPEYAKWLNYFDVVVTGAQKPGFFTEDTPFVEIDRERGAPLDKKVVRFEPRHAYQGGNLRRFEALLGARGEEILYVGDHIYGDVIRSKKETLWRTALIIEELEHELSRAREMSHAHADLVELDERRADLEDAMTRMKLELSGLEHAIDDKPERMAGEQSDLMRRRRQLRQRYERDKRALRRVIEERRGIAATIDAAYNRYWGSLFAEGSENSCFGRQVEDYACLYTSRASNLLYYSPSQYFRAPRHWMAHEKL